MRLRTVNLLKAMGILMLLIFTTGIVLPWVISNVLMPVWMIIFTLGGIVALWVVLLERPYYAVIKYLLSFRNSPTEG